MNPPETARLLEESVLHQQVQGTLDELSLQVIRRRRRLARSKGRGWLARRMLLGADLAGLLAAFVLARLIVGRHAEELATPGLAAETAIFALTLPLWVIWARAYGLYGRDEGRADHSTVDDMSGVFHFVTVGVWLGAGVAYLAGMETDLAPFLVFWGLAVVLVMLFRAIARAVWKRRVAFLQNVIIVGAGDIGQTVARKLRQHPEYGINVVGFVDNEPKELDLNVQTVPLLGPTWRLPLLVEGFGVERVVVAFSRESHEESLALIRQLDDLDVQIDVVPRLFEAFGPNIDFHAVEGLPLLGMPPLRLSNSALLLKRTLDVLGAALGLLCAAPLFLALAVAIRIDSPGPVFYRSRRIGRNGKRLDLLKFRTMYRDDCVGDAYGGDTARERFEAMLDDPLLRDQFEHAHKFDDDPRITRLGRFLRTHSLDELPQLINVLRGDISLVGPRAITMEELALMNGRFDRPGRPAGYWQVKDLRPGITGYWQITGRSMMGYEERLRLDMLYVRSWSLKFDFTILAKTVRVFLATGGAR